MELILIDVPTCVVNLIRGMHGCLNHYTLLFIRTGGRDCEGCPILKLTQPKTVEEAMLREIPQEGILDMLIYFTSVPRFVIGTSHFHNVISHSM